MPYEIDHPETAIGFTPNTNGEYTLSVANNKKNVVDSTTVFLPVPKENDNFGLNIQSEAFAFNMKINGAPKFKIYDKDGNDVTSARQGSYKIGYASGVTESNYKQLPGSGTGLYGNTFSDSTNMIRIHNIDPIPVGERVELMVPYTVDENSSTINPAKFGKIVDFRPYYYTSAGSAGYTHGTRVGIVLEVGEVSGYVFKDENFDGLFNNTETKLTGQTVKLYKSNGDFVKAVQTDSNGHYAFDNLSAGEYTIDFNEMEIRTSLEYFSPQQTFEYGKIKSLVPNTGLGIGKITGVNPTDDKASELDAGILNYDENSIGISSTPIVIQEPSSTGDLSKSKAEINFTFTPENFDKIGNYVLESSDRNIVVIDADGKALAVRDEARLTDATTSIKVIFKDDFGNEKVELIPVTVKTNKNPEIKFASEPLVYAVNDAVNLKDGMTATDIEDGDLTSKVVITPNTVDNTKEGIHEVTYKVTDNDNNVSEVKRTVVVGDVEVIDDYVIKSENFVVLDTNVKESPVTDRDAQIMDLSKVSVYNFVNKEYVDAEVKDAGGYSKTEAIYDIELAVKEKNTVSTKVKGTVKGNIVPGNKYYIGATDATITVKEAKEVINDLDLLIGHTNAEAFKIVDNSAATVKVVDSQVKVEAGTYTVELAVDEEPNTKITVEITVDKGAAPILNIPKYSEVQVGEAFDYTLGVTATDDRDGDLTSLVTHTGVVDETTKGIYTVEYQVVDSDDNITKAKTLVAVNDGGIKIKDGYMIDADHFMIQAKDVTGDLDAQILSESNAQAYEIATAKKVAVSVEDMGGYSSVVSDYNVTLVVDAKKSVTKEITAAVVSGVVVKGDAYYITANDITIGLEAAKTFDDVTLVTAVGARSFNKRDLTKGTIDVVTNGVTAIADTYTTELVVAEDSKAVVKPQVEVLDYDIVVETDEYIIVANSFMIGDAEIKDLSVEDIIALADAKAWKKEDASTLVAISILGTVDQSIGTHPVTFVVDEDNSVMVTVDMTVIKDTMYYVEAHDAEITIGDLSKLNNDKALSEKVIELTQAKAWKVNVDGSKESMPVFIGNLDAFKNAKAGSKIDVEFVMVQPSTFALGDKTAMSYDINKVGVSAQVSVLKDAEVIKPGKTDDSNKTGSLKGNVSPDTGVSSNYVSYLLLILVSLSAIVLKIVKDKRKKITK